LRVSIGWRVSTINKASLSVVIKPCYQTQQLSLTENNFPFLILQKKQFFEKVTFSTGSLCARSRSTPMNVKAIDHIVLTVKDIDATCAFYARVLGMSVITFGGGRRALSFGAQKINLHQSGREFEPKAKKPTPGSADLCFVTSMSVSDVVEHLRACGVELLEGPVQRTGAVGPIMSVYFRDPDGNLIEVSAYEGA
jgi:catechol 2,3-dioxygenase-like lactoylglutathione lyase family enzyme